MPVLYCVWLTQDVSLSRWAAGVPHLPVVPAERVNRKATARQHPYNIRSYVHYINILMYNIIKCKFLIKNVQQKSYNIKLNTCQYLWIEILSLGIKKCVSIKKLLKIKTIRIVWLIVMNTFLFCKFLRA